MRIACILFRFFRIVQLACTTKRVSRLEDAVCTVDEEILSPIEEYG